MVHVSLGIQTGVSFHELRLAAWDLMTLQYGIWAADRVGGTSGGVVASVGKGPDNTKYKSLFRSIILFRGFMRLKESRGVLLGALNDKCD